MVELVFMMFVLKLPIVYLGLVCWWAIRAEPKPLEPSRVLVPVDQPEDPPKRWQPRGRGSGLRGGPNRGYARTSRARAALR